ncbi:PREDICTED: uncharacterized protein K02A2.6-like [Acropora digitifera]|uniref:uncharacterized protein K02A2.6-like n=1 Tax=Acropora digitifera TaxID=70779 RepID=UPI00077A67F3|nr:PREDICTED: uncharacterized protein K02A2.6-like [Acropora digitifera]
MEGDKCEFRLTKLKFFGHELSTDGVSPSEEKISTIRDARSPIDASEVQSFMGLVQYSAKFMPDLLSIARSIQDLTRKGVPFVWAAEQQKAFQELKHLITQAETPAYYQVGCRTSIVADASPVGLGAVLTQQQGGVWRVISYASRSLTDVEMRYSQTEKEALALVWACKRFSMYVSDAGQEYDSVQAIVENCIPVALSAREIEEASYNDAELSQVKGCVRTGKWERCTFPSYAHVKDELCIYLLRGSRIVVPKTLRDKVVRLVPQGHQGIVKTKYRLRSKVWWPGMDKDVEQLYKVCPGCQVNSRYDPPEPMSRVLPPSAPWQDSSADLLGTLPNGESIWVLVDYFSTFEEVYIWKSTTSAKIIEAIFLCLPDLVYRFLYEQSTNRNLFQENSRHFLIAHLEKKNWHAELISWLTAYRSTPQVTTGATPFSLMFGREMRSKLPELRRETVDVSREATRDTDWSNKLKGKDYADERRRAVPRSLRVGDAVLHKAEKTNKLSSNFSPSPFKVV